MSRKTKEEAEKTRTRILASALSLFTKKGYEHTTFSDIAARLKMTKGAVYWHFETKEDLLSELMRIALEKFHRQLATAMPDDDMTYMAVVEMMVKNAESVVEDPRAAAFFRLMKCQIKWADASMDTVRNDLMTNLQYGPKEAFRKALEKDIAAGRARSGIDAEEISTVSIAIWDGLVQARIDHFLECDMSTTLRHAYAAIWNNLKRTSTTKGSNVK